MTPLVLIDAIHRAERTAKAVASVAFLLTAPGWALFGAAWVRSRREWR
jgi:hypothetical protein